MIGHLASLDAIYRGNGNNGNRGWTLGLLEVGGYPGL